MRPGAQFGRVVGRERTGRVQRRNSSYSKTLSGFGFGCELFVSCTQERYEYRNVVSQDWWELDRCLSEAGDQLEKDLEDCEIDVWDVVGVGFAIATHVGTVMALAAPPPISTAAMYGLGSSTATMISAITALATKFANRPSCAVKAGQMAVDRRNSCYYQFGETWLGRRQWELGKERCRSYLTCGSTCEVGLSGPGVHHYPWHDTGR